MHFVLASPSVVTAGPGRSRPTALTSTVRSKDHLSATEPEKKANEQQELNKGISIEARSKEPASTLSQSLSLSFISNADRTDLEPRRRLGVVLGHERLADEPDGVERVRSHDEKNEK